MQTELHRQYMKEWRDKNKDHIRNYDKKWKVEHPDYNKKYEDNWRRKNFYYYWAHGVWRNHINKKYVVNITKAELIELGKQIHTCRYCGTKLDYSFKEGRGSQFNSPSLDRINNGKIIDKNTIQIICRRCNLTKQDRTHENFIEYCRNINEQFGKHL